MQLEDRVALVTGGASGLGRGIARVMAERGAEVAVCDIDLDGARQTAERIAAGGRRASAYEVDVTSRTQLRDMVDGALADFGRIDILVNAAGVIGAAGFEDTTTSREEDWDLTFDVNVKGTALASDAVSACMKARQSGKIVNIASHAGRGGGRGRGRLWRIQSRRHPSHAVVCDGACAVQHQCQCDLPGQHLDADVGAHRRPLQAQQPGAAASHAAPDI